MTKDEELVQEMMKRQGKMMKRKVQKSHAMTGTTAQHLLSTRGLVGGGGVGGGVGRMVSCVRATLP